jgi:hypothetical protein
MGRKERFEKGARKGAWTVALFRGGDVFEAVVSENEGTGLVNAGKKSPLRRWQRRHLYRGRLIRLKGGRLVFEVHEEIGPCTEAGLLVEALGRTFKVRCIERRFYVDRLYDEELRKKLEEARRLREIEDGAEALRLNNMPQLLLLKAKDELLPVLAFERELAFRVKELNKELEALRPFERALKALMGTGGLSEEVAKDLLRHHGYGLPPVVLVDAAGKVVVPDGRDADGWYTVRERVTGYVTRDYTWFESSDSWSPATLTPGTGSVRVPCVEREKVYIDLSRYKAVPVRALFEAELWSMLGRRGIRSPEVASLLGYVPVSVEPSSGGSDWVVREAKLLPATEAGFAQLKRRLADAWGYGHLEAVDRALEEVPRRSVRDLLYINPPPEGFDFEGALKKLRALNPESLMPTYREWAKRALERSRLYKPAVEEGLIEPL